METDVLFPLLHMQIDPPHVIINNHQLSSYQADIQISKYPKIEISKFPNILQIDPTHLTINNHQLLHCLLICKYQGLWTFKEMWFFMVWLGLVFLGLKGNCTVWFILLAAVMMIPVQNADPSDFDKNVHSSLSKWCEVDPIAKDLTSPLAKLLKVDDNECDGAGKVQKVLCRLLAKMSLKQSCSWWLTDCLKCALSQTGVKLNRKLFEALLTDFSLPKINKLGLQDHQRWM